MGKRPSDRRMQQDSKCITTICWSPACIKDSADLDLKRVGNFVVRHWSWLLAGKSSGDGGGERLIRRSVRANAITGVGTNEPQYPQGAALPGTP